MGEILQPNSADWYLPPAQAVHVIEEHMANKPHPFSGTFSIPRNFADFPLLRPHAIECPYSTLAALLVIDYRANSIKIWGASPRTGPTHNLLVQTYGDHAPLFGLVVEPKIIISANRAFHNGLSSRITDLDCNPQQIERVSMMLETLANRAQPILSR